jgi:peptidoglycan/xylan/chitin deacetylase (PgdA/CDA1 family)
MKKKIFGVLVVLLLVFGGLLLWLPSRYAVPVLMYHSIDHTSHEPLNNVTPQTFSRQMAALRQQGCNVISIKEFAEGMQAGRRFAHKTVVITFDDGYDDNYTSALPVLRAYGFPAVLFLAPDHIGTRGYLTWDQIRQMAANGITIGSHVMGETYLPSLQGDKLVWALEESKRLIERELALPVEYLSYPVGGFTHEAQSAARNAGYRAAFTTNRGFSRGVDIFALRRIRVKDTDGPWAMMLKTSGYYDLFRSVKAPF